MKHETCHVCDGTGWRDSTTWPCPTCDGTGFVSGAGKPAPAVVAIASPVLCARHISSPQGRCPACEADRLRQETDRLRELCETAAGLLGDPTKNLSGRAYTEWRAAYERWQDAWRELRGAGR